MKSLIRHGGLWVLLLFCWLPGASGQVGRVAGIGASLQGFITTLGGALLGALIGREFNGSTLPLAAGALCSGALSLAVVLLAERGRLFRPHHPVAASARTL